MKYRVVGWTHYDAPDVSPAECDEAAYWAIVRDIREHGYRFTGWEHQEEMGGAPVLNDGCKRLFSQRDFGCIMAYAHGDFSRMGYVAYAFHRHPESEPPLSMPPPERIFDPLGFVPEQVDAEESVCTVDRDTLAAAKAGKHFKLPFDDPALQTLGSGDILTLCCEGERYTCRVSSAKRGPDLTDEEIEKIMVLSCSAGIEKMDRADAIYNAAPWVIEVTPADEPV